MQINKNKKIYFLIFLTYISSSSILAIGILYTAYLVEVFKKTTFAIIIIIIGIIMINVVTKLFEVRIINHLIKNEYIKLNKSIRYLKYIPEDKMYNIEFYIEENKKELELKYEKELLKKEMSNF